MSAPVQCLLGAVGLTLTTTSVRGLAAFARRSCEGEVADDPYGVPP
ncbi:hypothetical protein [Nonomuraea diastatica]|nr:hypothetical protein [Nonomuraea diastatica]